MDVHASVSVNFILTSENNTNDKKLQNNGNKVNRYNSEKIVNFFKKTSLKSTIIVDNKGNNNLDLEQKKNN